jgi:hypothetical protein
MSGSAVSQDRIKKLRDKLFRNITLIQSRGSTGYRIYNSGIYSAAEFPKDEPLIQLASTSKVLIALEAALGLETEAIIPLTAEMLVEVVERNPAHLNTKLYKGLGRLLTQARIIASMKAAGIKTLRKNLLTQLGNGLRAAGITIPISEAYYQSITLSSNSATAAIKALRGSDINPTALDREYRRYASSYTMLETLQGNHHWGEYAPNTGLLSELGEVQDLLVRRHLAGSANELESILASSLLNNPQDFGHCFTHSPYGEGLRSVGYEIYEKTGYYPCVTWIEALADLGYPPICTVSTVVTIVTPQGVVHTVSAFINAEVAYPWTTVEEDGVTFPDEWSDEYIAYIKTVKAELDQQLRTLLTQKVESLLLV